MTVPDAASRRARVEAIRTRVEAATDPKYLGISRYDHGGGRIYFEAAQGRGLVADLYAEPDREFYWSAAADVRWLLAELERVEALAARREEQLLELSIAVIQKEVTP